MNPIVSLAATLAVAVALPAGAASSAASSASDSLATSSGSVSDSLRGSSGSSTAVVAEGEYRVVDVAEAPQRPGDRRLTLQRASGDDTVVLTLPLAALDRARLAAGDTVTAKHRRYGIEFRDGRSREPFFLVLDDDWQRGLKTVPVPG